MILNFNKLFETQITYVFVTTLLHLVVLVTLRVRMLFLR